MSTLLSIKGVSKVYGSGETAHQALKDINLDIKRGETLGLLGVNGAGKTTLANIITTLTPPTNGTLSVHGKSIYDDIPAYRKMIGFCPQKPNVNPFITIEKNLHFAGLFNGLSHAEAEQRVAKSMKRFQLEQYANNYIDDLSGGYKQRYLIARALIHKPQLILFDEPTVALDPHIRYEVWDLLRELRAQGVTIILTTHYLDEAEALSDRVCIMDEGVIRLIDTPENLKAEHEKEKLEDVFIKLINEKDSEQ